MAPSIEIVARAPKLPPKPNPTAAKADGAHNAAGYELAFTLAAPVSGS